MEKAVGETFHALAAMGTRAGDQIQHRWPDAGLVCLRLLVSRGAVATTLSGGAWSLR